MDVIHPTQLLLALLEGLGLILSPCILPILPIMLAASLDGGKARPLGIITGFIGAFTVFFAASRGKFWRGLMSILKSYAMWRLVSSFSLAS